MRPNILPGVIAMATVVVSSNILVQFLLFDGLLTWGAFTYPVAFLVTDLMNRVYGAGAARRVALAGLAVGILCSLIGSQIELEFGPAVPLRIAIASATAFLVAQFLDISVFDRLRAGAWWRAPLASTLIGSTIDSVLFFTIAFAGFLHFGVIPDQQIAWAQQSGPLLMVGPIVPLWITLGIADFGVKLAVALVALVPFRVLTARFAAS